VIHRIAVTESTNADLLAAAEAGEVAGPTAFVADHQTAGRGRLDRTWTAPPGANLLVSLTIPDAERHPTALMHAVGLAAVDAVEALAGTGLASRLGLKWPNDVLLDGRKLAGVLAQRAPNGSVVVGIGVNVGWCPDGAASLHRDAALPAATPSMLLGEMLASLDSADVGVGAHWNEPLAERYRSRLSTLGQHVRVELPGDRFLVGRATDIGADGRLHVTDEAGTAHVLDVGDVVHLRRG